MDYAADAWRRAAGLGTLSVYDPLTSASRARSGDMLTNNFFAHSSPSRQTQYSLLEGDGTDLRSRGREPGEGRRGSAASVDAAIEALMASPTHRANILNPAYREVGVGAASGGDALTIFTSIFTDR
ncbi:MAG: CAP domain-containing protein [Dehalococcoidia bacterium]